MRTLHRCDVVYTDVGGTSPGLAVVLEGDGFLYNMVRIVAGTLVRIGLHHHDGGGEGSGCELPEAAKGVKGAVALPEGASPPVSHDVMSILEAEDRSHAGPTAPAAGLCLEHVEYEKEWAATHWDYEGPLYP